MLSLFRPKGGIHIAKNLSKDRVLPSVETVLIGSPHFVGEKRNEDATPTAAIAAVSARKMVLPREADIHPLWRNSSASFCVHPPSGPNARASGGVRSASADLSETLSSYSDKTMRLPPTGAISFLRFAGALISGGASRRDCCDASRAILCH